MEGGEFVQQISRQRHFLIQQQQHGLSWLSSLWSKEIIQVVNNIHCTWENTNFLFNYCNKVYGMTIIRQPIRSFNISWQLKEIWLSFVPVGGNLNLVWVGWGIWTGSVKSFQPNKRVLAEEFKDRATTLRGETEETKRNSYIPFNSLVHIVLFLGLSVKISMNGCLRSSLAWRVFVSQNLMYYISVMNYMFSTPNKKRFHLG